MLANNLVVLTLLLLGVNSASVTSAGNSPTEGAVSSRDDNTGSTRDDGNANNKDSTNPGLLVISLKVLFKKSLLHPRQQQSPKQLQLQLL